MLNWNDVLRFADKGNPAPDRRVEKTEEEWRKILTPEQFSITRLKGTEPAGSGALRHAHDAGRYDVFAAIHHCSTPLSSSVRVQGGPALPSR